MNTEKTAPVALEILRNVDADSSDRPIIHFGG